jgi:hypothetical protein
MRPLPHELLARERERAGQRLGDAATPAPGDLWTVKPTIVSPAEPNRVIEHSKVPLVVTIVRLAGTLVEVAPVSFEMDLTGELDVMVEDDKPLGQPFVVELWLRMPVTMHALARKVGALRTADATRVLAEGRTALSAEISDLPELDPRRAYRQDERMRVIFAMAGTGEELVLSTGSDADAGALQIKRHAARWIARPVPRTDGKIVSPYHDYEESRPASAGRVPTTGGHSK